MSTHYQSAQKTELNQILEILHEIGQKSLGGNCIYRGEPECYEKVSSSLYRKLEAAQMLHLNVEDVQKAEIDAAKDYTDQTDEFEILVQLQHFGGKTNLIDFTTDYFVALFFAANGSPSEDGRVILQDKTGEVSDWIRELQDPDPKSRPRAQKSIFVRPPNGFIDPDEEFIIPKSLKRPLLDYLEREHAISHKKVYYDLHGFINSRDLHWNIYEELGKSLACQRSGDRENDAEEKDQYYQKAVNHSTNAIQQMPHLPEAYNIRGFAYFCQNDFDNAIDDYTRAITLKPGFTEAYNGRSAAYRAKGDFDNAIDDSSKAIRLNSNHAPFYYARGLAYFSKNDYDNALTDYTQGIRLDPNCAFAYHYLGLCYSATGDVDIAFSNFNKAVCLDPEYAIAYCGRSLTYFQKDDFDSAISDLDMAIKLDPENSLFYCSRGIVWLHLKNWDRARTDLINATDKGLDIIAEFHDRYESIAVLEQEIGDNLPEDIVAMLQRQ